MQCLCTVKHSSLLSEYKHGWFSSVSLSFQSMELHKTLFCYYSTNIEIFACPCADSTLNVYSDLLTDIGMNIMTCVGLPFRVTPLEPSFLPVSHGGA